MRNFARQLSPLLTVYLLIVSLGLPLHKAYCACRGITDFSLLEQTHRCSHHIDMADEVAMPSEVHHASIEGEKTSCCAKSSASHCTAPAVDQHDCGNEETFIAKFTPDYLFNKTQEFGEYSSWEPIFFSHLNTVFSYVKMVPKALPIRGPDPPPLPYGRTLLVRQQVFLC